VMVVAIAYTGARWSEIVGLTPECVDGDTVNIDWKLYELNGRFYRGSSGQRLAAGTCRGRGNARLAVPVLVTEPELFPGRPVPPWPPAMPGETFTPPGGRGLVRLVSDQHTGRCPSCGRAWPRRMNGTLIAHTGRESSRCSGSGQQPAEDVTVASWLPVPRGVTPHGLRHGLQVWMDEDSIPEVLKTERMGYEMPGMHGVYGHVSLPCGPTSKPLCKNAGKIHYVNEPGSARALSCPW